MMGSAMISSRKEEGAKVQEEIVMGWEGIRRGGVINESTLKDAHGS